MLQHLSGAVMIVAGGVNALLPTFVLIKASQVLEAPEAGMVAVALSVSGYVSQLISSASLEARLVSAGSDPLRPPYWVSACGLGGGGMLLASPRSLSALIGLAIALSALEVGRAAAMADRRVAQEVSAALLLVVGTSAMLLLEDYNEATLALALATIVVIGLRVVVTYGATLGQPAGRGWILAETAVSGISQPLLTSLVYAILGPVSAITLRLAVSLSGAVSPILGYLRWRLLRAPSPRDMVTALTMFAVAVVVLTTALNMDGIRTWLETGSARLPTLALVLALAWRLAALASTPGFARLRRSGDVAATFKLRVIFTGLYLVLGLSGAWLAGTPGVLTGFLLAELTAAFAYSRRSR